MVDVTVGKLGSKAIAQTQQQGAKDLQKQGPSKFDDVRAKLDAQLADRVKVPPTAQVSPAQKKLLESDLRKRLERTRSTTPTEFFKVEMKNNKTGVERLRQAVGAMPKIKALEPIRQRLSAIETQFEQSGKLLKGLGTLDSPQGLLKVQVQMYQLTQNIELMSKVVDQVNSGIKTVLQTQV